MPAYRSRIKMELKVEGSEIHLRCRKAHLFVQKTLARANLFKTFIAPLKDDTRFLCAGAA